MKSLAKFLQVYLQIQVEMGGYTDSQGRASYNQRLSLARSDAVKAMLVKKFGIDETRIIAKGYGENSPVADNKTVSGRATNRRVIATIETIEKVQMKQNGGPF